MKPTYTYRSTHYDYELTQDGFVLGYIKRGISRTKHSGAECGCWAASLNGNIWHDIAFPNREAAREYLESL